MFLSRGTGLVNTKMQVQPEACESRSWIKKLPGSKTKTQELLLSYTRRGIGVYDPGEPLYFD
jgi:hypothetical protein